MPCCCTSVFRICDVVVCDDQDLVLPVPIPADGEYTMELKFLDNVKRVTASFSAGDNATFAKTGLNEVFTYVGHVEDASGQEVEFEVDGKTYNCFEFTTTRAI
jgi:hypothetical protein